MMHKNDEAVSPVIGVILMVAITVILAAVIAAFVFGMAGQMQKTKIVAATAQQIGDLITITYQGGQDSDQVKTITAKVTDGTGADVTVDPSTDFAASPPKVGSTATAAGSTGKDHIVAVAEFNDGTEQVILDNYV